MIRNLMVLALLSGSIVVPEPEPFRGSQTACTLYESKVGDDTVSFQICEPQLSATPSWTHPEVKQPPVSVSQAVAVSKVQLANLLPHVKGWDLVGVQLHSFFAFDNLFAVDKWYYVVSWRPATWRTSGQGEPVRVGVLMNGQAVELVVTDKTNKDNTSIK